MSNDITNSPGVFRGNTQFASRQDLLTLKEEIISILKGNPSIHDLSENGYIPWVYNNDGTLNIDYLFPDLVSMFNEKSGLTIYKDGILYKNDIKSINFSGQYVKLDLDEDGNLILNIDEPSDTISRFNEANSISNALVKITSDLKNDMIIPLDKTDLPFYGDWVPGEKHIGKNWNGSSLHDYIELTTEGPIYASSMETYFEVLVYDAYDNLYDSFVSTKIKSNTHASEKLAPDSSKNSAFINIYISMFKEENNGYSFIPTFKLNLIKIIGLDGGRFKIKIIHHDDVTQSSYISNDMLYNVGTIPIITDTKSYINNDDNLPAQRKPEYKWCSGLKYASNGEIIVKLIKIHNLNNMAANDSKASYIFDKINSDNVKIDDENYTLDLNGVSTWKATFPIEKNIINNTIISGNAYAENAFGKSDYVDINIPILLNTIEEPKQSNNLIEYFTDESFRLISDFSSNETEWDSTQDIIYYDNGNALLVVPNIGLKYPYGNWTKYIPEGSPDYSNASYLINEKYFARIFKGNEKLKYGGIFVFEGISKDDFLNERISCIISCDNGKNWCSLKDIRNSLVSIQRNNGTIVASGILTDLKEHGNKLYVHWSYPGTTASSNKIFFKFGMQRTSPYCIKSIQLLNADGTEDW